jgi:Zn-dependent peptidase ImmA (M78 family)
MIPEKITIQGVEWKIEIVGELYDELGRPLYGLCDSDNKTIKLIKDKNKKRLKHTLLHELAHSIFNQSGLHQCYDYNMNYEEIICEQLASFFTSDAVTVSFKKRGDQKSEAVK